MTPVLRRVLSLAFGLGATISAPAALLPGVRNSEQFRPSTTFVSIQVPASAFDPATGLAVVPMPRAILGQLHAAHPWTLRARAGRAGVPNLGGGDDKPCTDFAIRASGTPTFKPLTPSGVPVLSGNKTNGWMDVALDLQVTARLADDSGRYVLQVLFDFQ